jgi:hypothetical protein
VADEEDSVIVDNNLGRLVAKYRRRLERRHRVKVTVEDAAVMLLIRGLGTVGLVRSCRGCGCTDDVGCTGGCFWAGPNLCSSCVPPRPPRQPKGPRATARRRVEAPR